MSAAVATALAFNLLCMGTEATVNKLDGIRREVPFVNTLTIDLEHKLWCGAPTAEIAKGGACKNINPIQEVSAYTITLEDYKGGTVSVSRTLNRTSGELSILMDVGTGPSIVSAKCEVQPFTGFPANKF